MSGVLLVPVRRSRVTDPVAFTLAIRAGLQAAQTDRAVSSAALMRAEWLFDPSIDDGLPPEFFRVLQRITSAAERVS